jgi:hypothetical protein
MKNEELAGFGMLPPVCCFLLVKGVSHLFIMKNDKRGKRRGASISCPSFFIVK